MSDKKTKFEPAPWVLGGCSGRMITTPSGYYGDGFIADVDTLANAKLVVKSPKMYDLLKYFYMNEYCGDHAAEVKELLDEIETE